MWRSGIINLIVAVVSVGVGAAEPPAQGTMGDVAIIPVTVPSDLNVQAAAESSQAWDPSAHLAGSWMSVSLTSRIDRNSSAPNRSVTVSGSYRINDPTGLLGLTRTPTGVVAVDQKAQVVYNTPVPKRSSRFYLPLQYTKTFSSTGQWVSELLPYTFSVDIPLDPNLPCPGMFTRLEWSSYALVTDTTKNVDIPFKASTVWVDVVPGMQVLVEKADVTGTTYQYSIKVKYSMSKVSMSPSSAFLTGSEKPAEVMVVNVDVLNAQGKSIRDNASGGFTTSSSYGGSGDSATGTFSGTGNCNICGTAATIRYTLALNAYEKEIRFLLQNVPVPPLWY